jgi:hypothetical protein
MLRNKNTLIAIIVASLIVITMTGQKPSVIKTKPWEQVNIDSLIKVTTEKNQKTISKRIGELKHAEKAADSLSKVVTVLKTENKQLYEKVSNVGEPIDTSTYQLLPISSDKNN